MKELREAPKTTQPLLLPHQAEWERYSFRNSVYRERWAAEQRRDDRMHQKGVRDSLKRDDEVQQSAENLLSLCSQHGETGDIGKMMEVCRQLPFKIETESALSTSLQGKKILDLYSGSAHSDEQWSGEFFPPLFARVCSLLGADVLAVDSRQQAPNEPFHSIQMEITDSRELLQRVSSFGPFDFINARGVIAPEIPPWSSELPRQWLRALQAELAGVVCKGGIIRLSWDPVFF